MRVAIQKKLFFSFWGISSETNMILFKDFKGESFKSQFLNLNLQPDGCDNENLPTVLG